jgi:LysR family transcriptional regulator, glycine cleavage system transcriptional activator
MKGEPRRRLPPLRMIATFEALARLGSRQAAAAELNVTPGAIAKQLRALEQWAGVPLFDNDVRDPAMTPAGRLLAQAVTAGMETILAGLEQIAPPRAETTSLRVLAPATLAMNWLVPRLHALERVEPQLRVSLHATHTGEDWLPLLHDAAIRRDGFVPPGYATEFLMREKLTAVVAPQLAAGADAPDALPLLESRSRAGDLDRWLAAAGVARLGQPRRCFAHFYIAYEAALAGEGLLVVPTMIASAHVEAGRLCQPWRDVTVTGAALALLYPRTGDTPARVAPFVAWLREAIVKSSGE